MHHLTVVEGSVGVDREGYGQCVIVGEVDVVQLQQREKE